MNKLAVDFFRDGVRDVDIRKAICLATPKSLTDALARALEVEAADGLAKRGRVRALEEADPARDNLSARLAEMKAKMQAEMRALTTRRQPRC